MKYEDLTIENIWSQFGLAPALAEGKVDAVVSWEPYVTQVLTQVPDSYEVIRGGQHMSYVMVATAHGPTIESKPALVKSDRRRAGAVLALHPQKSRRGGGDFRQMGAWHRCRHRQEGDQEHSLRPASVGECAARLRERRGRSADEHAQRCAATGRAQPVPAEFMAEVEKEHPEYFADLPKLLNPSPKGEGPARSAGGGVTIGPPTIMPHPARFARHPPRGAGRDKSLIPPSSRHRAPAPSRSVFDPVRIGRSRMLAPLFNGPRPRACPNPNRRARRLTCAQSTDSRSVTVAMELFQRLYQPARLMTASISTIWRSS